MNEFGWFKHNIAPKKKLLVGLISQYVIANIALTIYHKCNSTSSISLVTQNLQLLNRLENFNPFLIRVSLLYAPGSLTLNRSLTGFKFKYWSYEKSVNSLLTHLDI